MLNVRAPDLRARHSRARSDWAKSCEDWRTKHCNWPVARLRDILAAPGHRRLAARARVHLRLAPGIADGDSEEEAQRGDRAVDGGLSDAGMAAVVSIGKADRIFEQRCRPTAAVRAATGLTRIADCGSRSVGAAGPCTHGARLPHCRRSWSPRSRWGRFPTMEHLDDQGARSPRRLTSAAR